MGLLNVDTKDKLLRALSIASGDQRGAAVLSEGISKREDDRRQSKAEEQNRMQWMQAYRTMFADATAEEAALAYEDAKGVGNTIAKNRENFTLGPAQGRYGSGGNMIAERPTATMQEVETLRSQSPGMRQETAGLLDALKGPPVTATPEGPLATPRGMYLPQTQQQDPEIDEMLQELRRRGYNF